jgi:uncharacterized membrane protein
MQLLLQDHFVQLWPMLAELSPTQERRLGSMLIGMFAWLWSFGAGASTTAYLTVVQHLDQNLAPTVFVGFFLIALGVALMAIESRSAGFNAASAKASKQLYLKFRSLASACMIGGLLLLVTAFIRLAWVNDLVHQLRS